MVPLQRVDGRKHNPAEFRSIEQLLARPDYDACVSFLAEKGWGGPDTPRDGDAILTREREKTWEEIRELMPDMSVFELSTLPKLRRIGLVRVTNLTDQAVFSLADRHNTLERIHLSYCEHITVLAIHFLLQRLTKLTHLSLTGIPAFRRAELQQFCRAPPRVRSFLSIYFLDTHGH